MFLPSDQVKSTLQAGGIVETCSDSKVLWSVKFCSGSRAQVLNFHPGESQIAPCEVLPVLALALKPAHFGAER